MAGSGSGEDMSGCTVDERERMSARGTDDYD